MTELFKNSAIFSKLISFGKKVSEKWNESQIGWFVTRNHNDIKTKKLT